MGQFFVSWATWEKLVFLLACAMVLTIILGCVKLAITYRQLRMYAQVTDREDTEHALQQDVRPTCISEKAVNEVPFGIRAIESGIEVEGVWISRGNTPEPVSHNTSSSSLWNHANPANDGEQGIRPPSQVINVQSRPPTRRSHHDDDQYSPEKWDGENVGRIDSSDENNPVTPTFVIRSRSQAHQRTNYVEFDLMQLHRRSQAAEIGQLTPRLRRRQEQGHLRDFTRSEALSTYELTDVENELASRSRSEPPSRTRGEPRPLSIAPALSHESTPFSDSLRSSSEMRESQVLRGHGTGFEILRPGTFQLPTNPPGPSGERGRKLRKERRHDSY